MAFLARRTAYLAAGLVRRVRRGGLLGGGLASFGIRATGLALTFAQNLVLARLLPLEQYGVFAICLSLATVLGVFASLGLGGLSSRELPRALGDDGKGAAAAFARTAMTCGLIAGGAVSVGLLALAAFVPHGSALPAGAFAAMAAFAPAFAILQVNRGLLLGYRRIIAGQLPVEILRPLLTVLFIAAAYVAGLSLSAVLAFALAAWATVLCAVLSTAAVRRQAGGAPAHNAPRLRAGPVRAALPFLFVIGSTMVGGEIGILLLGWMHGAEAAGQFQPVAKLAMLAAIGREAINAPLAPRLALLFHEGDVGGARRLCRNAALLLSAGTGALALCLALGAEKLLGFYGEAFIESAHMLAWLAGVQALSACFGPAPIALAMAGEMRLRSAIQLLTVLVQVVGGAILIQYNGVEGAAQAMALGLLVWCGANWLGAVWRLRVDTSLAAFLTR